MTTPAQASLRVAAWLFMTFSFLLLLVSMALCMVSTKAVDHGVFSAFRGERSLRTRDRVDSLGCLYATAIKFC